MINDFMICIMQLRKIILAILFLLITSAHLIKAQSRIHFYGRDLFMSGMNVAWVNYAKDLGAAPLDTAKIRIIFQTVHANGGNAMRLWLNTNCSHTPQFNSYGFIIGPGVNAIQDLKDILSIAQQNDIGLQLCLLSFNMLSTTELDTTQLNFNFNLLTDTTYTMSYVRNALIPMVQAVKGNSAIIGWEVFNEAEGMAKGYGWSGIEHIAFADIQRDINLIAGAIHRADPNAIVTCGASSIHTLSDVTSLSKITGQNYLDLMSSTQKDSMTEEFNEREGTNFTTKTFIAYLEKVASYSNYNYYRDDRLIAAGGDSSGILDYYNVHFYGPKSESPFNHPCSFWSLTKSLVVGEFYMQDTYGVTWQNLYEQLFNTGYSGAMSWSWWGDTPLNDHSKNQNHSNTLQALNEMLSSHEGDILVNPQTGIIYEFFADSHTIQKGDSTKIHWLTGPGSILTLNGISVADSGSEIINPNVTTKYILIASGQVRDTSIITINVLPTGRIISFKALPSQIGTGESASIVWQVVKSSLVILNNQSVNVSDSIIVNPDSNKNSYTLIAQGDERDSITLKVSIFQPDKVDRAFDGFVTASSNDTASDPGSNPQNLDDENNTTQWQAINADSQFVQIDLAKPISINKIIIFWGNQGYASQYSVLVSNDQINWQVLKTISNGTGGILNEETLDNLQGSGRYLMLQLQTRAINAFNIADIYVYGLPVASGIKSTDDNVPKSFTLYQNYPNPFNPSTEIKFSIPRSNTVRLEVFNLLGQKVATLVNQQLSAGVYTEIINAFKLSSGIYFYVLKAGNTMIAKKMILMK